MHLCSVQTLCNSFLGYSFGNVLADGLMKTPIRFFKQKLLSDTQADQLETKCGKHSANTTAKSNSSEDSTVLANHITAKHSEESKDDGQRQPEIVPQFSAFSRKNIAQLEVNMFDLMGHHDSKTGIIESFFFPRLHILV